MEPSRQAASKSDTHVTFRQGYQDTNYIGITIGDQQDEGTKSTTMNKGPPLPQHIGTPLDYRHSFNGFSRTKTTRQQQQQQQQPTSSSSLSRHASISLPAINTNLHPPPPQHHHIPSGSPMLSPRYPATPTFQQSSPLYSPLRSAPPPLSPIYKPSSPVKSGAFWKVKASSSSYPPPPPPLRASTSSNKVKYTSN